jgi:hypothetical protein
MISPAAVGLNFSAIVFITLRDASSSMVRSFDAALVDIPEVVSADRLFVTRITCCTSSPKIWMPSRHFTINTWLRCLEYFALAQRW